MATTKHHLLLFLLPLLGIAAISQWHANNYVSNDTKATNDIETTVKQYYRLNLRLFGKSNKPNDKETTTKLFKFDKRDNDSSSEKGGKAAKKSSLPMHTLDKSGKSAKKSERGKIGKQTDDHSYSPPDQVDVVIIGAGSAGLSAAARLEEFAENVTYVVLEAQGRVGGRAQSRVLDFGDFQGDYTIEEGANWIVDSDNPILELAQKYDIEMTLQNWSDIAPFQGGVPISDETMKANYNKFYEAWDCLQNYTWAPSKDASAGEDIDIGTINVMSLCGWNVSSEPQDNIKHFMQWFYSKFVVSKKW